MIKQARCGKQPYLALIFSLFSCDTNLFPKEEYIEPKPVINTDISQITFNNLRRTKIIDISGVGGFESTSEKTAIMASEIISEDTPQSDYPSLSYSVYRVKSGDMVGILAKVSTECSNHNINVLEVTQSILQDLFAMIMMVDFSKSDLPFTEFSDMLGKMGNEMGLSIHVMHEDIFNAMHTI